VETKVITLRGHAIPVIIDPDLDDIKQLLQTLPIRSLRGIYSRRVYVWPEEFEGIAVEHLDVENILNIGSINASGHFYINDLGGKLIMQGSRVSVNLRLQRWWDDMIFPRHIGNFTIAKNIQNKRGNWENPEVQ
jgi:hypothetical protein